MEVCRETCTSKEVCINREVFYMQTCRHVPTYCPISIGNTGKHTTP